MVANRKKSQGPPPKGLVVFGILAALAALAYATLSSGSKPTSAGNENQTARPAPAVLPVDDEPPAGASYDQLVSTGNVRMDAGLYAAAIKYYTRALAIDSTSADVWVDRGACKHALGDEPAAIEDFRRGLQITPEHVIAHFNLGVAFLTQNQQDSARVWWERMLVLAPSGVHSEKARQYLSELAQAGR